MIKGIYNSASGMLPRILKQEIYANNMANVNTPGFKKDDVFLKTLSDAQKGDIITDFPWETPMADEVYIDYQQGSLEKTDGENDLAIEGNGFFAVETQKGTRYTRGGEFSISSQGVLIDGQGNPVLSDSGPVFILGERMDVGQDGTISVDGSVIGKIKVVDFDKPYKLKKTDNGYFIPSDPTAAEKPSQDAQVRQGYLEKSNINIVEVMVDMLASFRSYEASQKAIQTQDETLDKAVNDLGRI